MFDLSRTETKPLLILLVGLLAVLPVNLLVGALHDDTADSALLAPPDDGGVWVLGNSIFKTGVDPDDLADQLARDDVAFEYHGGHYTSLWYLIVRNALDELRARPEVVVWGFRPAYAELPAFRQNIVNSTEVFYESGDALYEALTGGAQPAPGNAVDDVASRLDDSLSDVALYAARGDAFDAVTDHSIRLGTAVARAIGATGGDLVQNQVVDGGAGLLDVLVQVVEGDEVLAEEQVVDGVGDFIIGDTATYEGSFVPAIAAELDQQGLAQVIVIWPPRSVAEGRPVETERTFVDAAIADLEAQGFVVLDLYNDPGISIEMYAAGDHFNIDGRTYVTGRVADVLRSLE